MVDIPHPPPGRPEPTFITSKRRPSHRDRASMRAAICGDCDPAFHLLRCKKNSALQIRLTLHQTLARQIPSSPSVKWLPAATNSPCQLGRRRPFQLCLISQTPLPRRGSVSETSNTAKRAAVVATRGWLWRNSGILFGCSTFAPYRAMIHSFSTLVGGRPEDAADMI
jgi:hypothetical protein